MVASPSIDLALLASDATHAPDLVVVGEPMSTRSVELSSEGLAVEPRKISRRDRLTNLVIVLAVVGLIAPIVFFLVYRVLP